VFERWHKKGGHFAAHEQPEALVRDLREMFGSGGIAAKAVAGANRRGHCPDLYDLFISA
jgi:hypothetical protein